MVSDMQVTVDDHKFNGGGKLFRLRDSRDGHMILLGISGDASWAHQFKKNLEYAYSNPEDIKEVDYKGAEFGAITLTESGRIHYYACSGVPIEVFEPYFGTGSGAEFGLGALYSGADLKEALRIASLLDINTGMGLQYESHKNNRSNRGKDKRRV